MNQSFCYCSITSVHHIPAVKADAPLTNLFPSPVLTRNSAMTVSLTSSIPYAYLTPSNPHSHPHSLRLTHKSHYSLISPSNPTSFSPFSLILHFDRSDRRAANIPRIFAKRNHVDEQSHKESSKGGKLNATNSDGGSVKEEHGLPSYTSSIRTVALCVSTAVIFGVGLGVKDGFGKASEFFAGYLLEQSLSVDNLFVFVLIFKYFKVPVMYQNRVLSYGIAGAIIFRLSLILLGAATLQRFEAVNLLLAAILLYSSFKLIVAEDEEEDLSDNFIVKTCQKFIPVTANYDGNRFFTLEDGVRKATPLLLTVAVIELSDIAFAVDSIPAVFGVTRDPFIVFSSNLFAILGLRSLYTLVSKSMSELEYLQPAIAIVLGFIGAKMILDFFGYHIGTEVSLGFVATSLTSGVLLSLIKKSE